MAKKQKTKNQYAKYLSKASEELGKHALKYCEDANNRMKEGQICITPDNQIIDGTFVCNMTGFPGVGITINGGGYQHLFGKVASKAQEIIDKKKSGDMDARKEKPEILIDMNTTKEEIDAYFTSLRFTKPENLSTINSK